MGWTRYLMIVALLCSCYKTRVGVERPGVQTHEERQWFALFGAVPLSDPGDKCPQGASFVEAKQSGTDILIGIGLAVAGGLVAAAVCDLDDDPTSEQAQAYASCVTIGVSLSTLIASRTVEYQCAGAGVPAPTSGADFTTAP